MLETLSISRYSPKGSDKAMSADNQQERLVTVGWVVGFVDGEGCFSVSIQRSPVLTLGWQVFPEFVVTQGAKSLTALESLQHFFNCGRVRINRRSDNHKEPLYRYCVRPLADHREKIIPFFSENRLRTAKAESFEVYRQVVSLMTEGVHKTLEGVHRIALLAKQINRQKEPLFLRILRDFTPGTE